MSNIDKNIHDVGVVLGVTNGVLSSDGNNGASSYDVYNHNLFGIHITKSNNALDANNPHICIGWSKMGDLSSIASKEELDTLYQTTWPDCKPKGKSQDIGQIWRFINEAKIGDFVIFGEGSLFHIGKIVSNYIYDNSTKTNEDSDYVNVRKVEWIKINLQRTMLSKNMHHSLGAAMSFWRMNDYKSAVEDILNDCYEPDEDIEESYDYDTLERIEGGTNVILYGVPGAGKSWTIEHEYMDEETEMERLVFHPDYTYSDFVGQILPKKKGDDISYDFIPGPFTKIMRDAYRNPTKKYILAIEEINRGNAPAIFGDIFQLLDRDKKGNSSYKIMNSDIAREMYGDENHDVSIPSNLTLLCTMNTSDQNVFTLDTAFQRRWNMRLIENSFRKDTQEEKDFAAKTILDTSVKWEAFCVAINNQILEKNQNMTSSEDKRLGTHFVSLDDLTMRDENSIADGKENKLKNRRFPEKVIKYLWDDAFKFYRDEIFKGELNSLEKVISVFTTKTKDDRFDIFKDNIRSAIFDENKKQ